ncbi:MAG: cysteine desulfurase family protein [Peptoniphilaceae bacterium]|nr:cysteine desulfurase family protein [Peptoniphilaceae bacterium]
MIYLDNAATSKMSKKAIEAEVYVLENYYANASAIHSYGMESENLIKKSRKEIANIINAKESEIYFTKGATESNNIVIASLASKEGLALSSSIEHSSVYDALNNSDFKKVTYMKNRSDGQIDLDDLKQNLSHEVKLLSLIYVNNETGSITDIKTISKIVKDFDENILIHLDATQALGKIPVDVEDLGVDTMSFSGHKFHGPKGVGGLYVKKKAISKIKPLLFGGRQEVISSGTENHPAIYAMGVALREVVDEDNYSYIDGLRTYLKSQIEENISDYMVISPEESYSPYILNVAFKNIKSEVLVHFLEDREIYVSSGSACALGAKSRILSALGVPADYIDGAIRFSFSRDIRREDLDTTVEALREGIEMIRGVF